MKLVLRPDKDTRNDEHEVHKNLVVVMSSIHDHDYAAHSHQVSNLGTTSIRIWTGD